MNEIIKKKRIRKPSFWKSYRIGLNETDSAKLEQFAKDRHMKVSSAVRQMIKQFTAIESGDLIQKVKTTFELVYGINPENLNVKHKGGEVIYYRHAYRNWLKHYTKLSLKEIGKMSNNVHYSTVIHSNATYDTIYKQIPVLRDNHDKFKELMA